MLLLHVTQICKVVFKLLETEIGYHGAMCYHTTLITRSRKIWLGQLNMVVFVNAARLADGAAFAHGLTADSVVFHSEV